jgi:hypothetical protein
MALEWFRAALWFKKRLNVFTHGSFLEFLGCLATVVLYKIVDDTLLEAQFDSYVLAKDTLTFKNILVCEDQFNA